MRQSDVEGAGVSGITGVWVSTDDVSVISDVKQIVQLSFPNARPENVVSISHRQAVVSPQPEQAVDELPTRSSGMVS